MCRHFVFSKKPQNDAQTPCTTQLLGGHLSSQVEGIKMETAECDVHADVHPTPETLKTCRPSSNFPVLLKKQRAALLCVCCSAVAHRTMAAAYNIHISHWVKSLLPNDPNLPFFKKYKRCILGKDAASLRQCPQRGGAQSVCLSVPPSVPEAEHMAAVTVKKFGCFFVFLCLKNIKLQKKLLGFQKYIRNSCSCAPWPLAVQWVWRALLCSLGGPLWSDTTASREKRIKWWLVLIKTIVCFRLKAKNVMRIMYEIKSCKHIECGCNSLIANIYTQNGHNVASTAWKLESLASLASIKRSLCGQNFIVLVLRKYTDTERWAAVVAAEQRTQIQVQGGHTQQDSPHLRVAVLRATTCIWTLWNEISSGGNKRSIFVDIDDVDDVDEHV